MHRLLPLLLLSGCAWLNGTGEAVDPPTTGNRPSDAPDFVVLACSGHEFTVNAGLYRPSYLIRDGAALDVGAALESLGASVSVWDHGDSFYDHDDEGNAFTPGSGEATDYGFLQLLEEMVFIRDSMIAQFDNPTRVVVLAHSHGVVWCHTAMHLISDLPVDVLIDLDGDVESWDSTPFPGVAADSWDAVISEYNGITGFEWAFDIRAARDGWTVPGLAEPQDIEDVVPASADLALEVWGGGQMLRDVDPNVRLDGSSDGILRFETGQSHEALARSGNEGVSWAVEQLLDYYTD